MSLRPFSSLGYYKKIVRRALTAVRSIQAGAKDTETTKRRLRLYWNETAYLKLNKIAAHAVCSGKYKDGLSHWLQSKNKDDFSHLPSISWNESGYLKLHADLGKADDCDVRYPGYAHWLNFGAAEGRQLPSVGSSSLRFTHPLKDIELKIIETLWWEEKYLELHPDVAEGVREGNFVSGFKHWQRFGIAQKREIPTLHWDEDAYLKTYADVARAVHNGDLQDGLTHFLSCGLMEKRTICKPIGPSWLMKEMKAISKLEPKLYPNQGFWAGLEHYDATAEEKSGVVLRQLFAAVHAKNYSHIFTVPHLNHGGADIGTLHHIHALSKSFDAKILVIATDVTPSYWASRLPDGAQFLHFGEICKNIPRDQALNCFVRLLLKVRASVIHNINSSFMWDALVAHGAALKSTSKLYCSLFNFHILEDGGEEGFPTHLEQTWQLLQTVFTDHARFADRLSEIYGLDRSLFTVARFPVSVVGKSMGRRRVKGEPPRVLWASRLVREKSPEVLAEVAKAMPDVQFRIHGPLDNHVDLRTANAIKCLGTLSNVTRYGSYEHFSELAKESYDAFLYTTKTDGLPNVLLEAISSGLTVVAPDIGGIRELMAPNSPMFIPDHADSSQFVTALRWILENPEEANKLSRMQQAEMASRHNWVAFKATLDSVPFYTKFEKDKTV